METKGWRGEKDCGLYLASVKEPLFGQELPSDLASEPRVFKHNKSLSLSHSLSLSLSLLCCVDGRVDSLRKRDWIKDEMDTVSRAKNPLILPSSFKGFLSLLD